MARSDTNKEPSGNKSSGAPKVAATYSPTTQCSTIGDAELNDPVLSLLPSPLSAPLLSALSPAPARRRRAQPTPHTVRHRRHRARLRSRLDYSRTPIIPPDYIKSMVSLNKVFPPVTVFVYI